MPGFPIGEELSLDDALSLTPQKAERGFQIGEPIDLDEALSMESVGTTTMASEPPQDSSWEALGFPSQQERIAADEQAAAEIGAPSIFDLNLKRASDADQASRGAIRSSAPFQVAEGAYRAAGDAVLNPLFAVEEKLGFETAGDMRQDRMARADIANMRDMGYIERQVSGITESLAQTGTLAATGGLPAILAGFGFSAHESGYREAKKSGATEEEAKKIARGNAAVEVGVMGAFHAVGLGGLESAFLKGSAWQGANKFAIQTAAELTEEELTTLGQNLASQGNAGKPQDYIDTAVQTIGTMGLVGGAKKVQDFVKRPSRRTAEAAGLDGLARTGQEREKVADRMLIELGRKVTTESVRTGEPSADAMEGEVEEETPTQTTTQGFTDHHEELLGTLTSRMKRRMRRDGFKSHESEPIVSNFQEWFRAEGYRKFDPGIHTEGFTTNESTPVPPDPVVPSAAAAGILPKSALQIDAIGSNLQRIGRNAKRWIKQNFLSGGEQNEATRQLLYQREGIIRGHLSQLSQNSRDLKRAIHKVYRVPRHKQIPSTVSQQLDEALKDPAKLAALPTEIAVELQKMRDHVDGLSSIAQSLPGASAELQLTIAQNMGHYITRTYKKFGANRDVWMEKALKDQQIMADFSTEVRQTSPNATDEEIRTLAETLLRRDTVSLADLGRFSPRTNRYVDVLKARKDLSPAVRKLYGEREDAFENYADTVSKLTNLVSHRLFVDELKKTGLQQGFFSDSSNQQPGHVQEVNHKQIPQLRGLEGVLMTPELADAINDIYTVNVPGKPARFIVGVMGLSKAAKTVGSVQATIRNLTGNIPIALANGAWNPREFAGAAKATWWNDLWNKGDAATKAEIRNLHELGLIEGVNVEALRDIAAHTSATLEDYIAGIDSRNHFKSFTRGVAKVYQSMDTVWKIHTFYSYLPHYRQAHPNMSEHELRMHVARIVREITPTYSEASKAAKFWARYMPVGPFAMFNAEMWRTTANRIRLTTEELRSGNPALQGLAARRVAGQAAALALPTAAALAAKAMIGMGDDEEEALRQRVAPWQKNAVLIPISKDPDTGKFEYFDASYNDPFSVFTNPLNALARGEGKEAAMEAAEPFIAEDLAIGMVMSIMRNSDENGKPVYDTGLLPTDQNKQIAQFIVSRFEPGTLTSLRRISRASKGQTSASGKSYELGNELSSFSAGVRLDTMDRAQSDYYRNRDFEARVQDAQGTIRRVFLRQGSFDPVEAQEAYQSAEAVRKQALNDWRQYVDGSIALGEKNAYAKVASDIGGESQVMKLMYAGQYAPYQFQESDLRKMLTLPQGEERLAMFRRLFETQAGE
jgi:hypothetical protein